ncbi:MAG TPA: DNA polymerase III subunit delta' [Clostridiales bacterium]|nr:DNA polymerase III subunit delta' [Clostridiales bacterium]
MRKSNVIGQSSLLDRFETMISSGRVAHAYLLAGPEGIGKTTMGKIFANMLLCTSSVDRPCGVCQSCMQFASGNHPDFIQLIPNGKSIKVDDILNLRRDIVIKPYQGNRKVYMVDDAHTMTQFAQNALLKTLEEPPSYATIILGTDNINALLPTIISRCQAIPMKRMPSDDIYAILIERGLSSDEANIFARMSEGLPGRAIALSLDENFKVLREDVISYLDNLLSMKSWEILKHTALFMDNRDDIGTILDILVVFMRDVLIYSETGDYNLIINRDKKSNINLYSNLFTTRQIKTIIENIETARKMLNDNANYQLTIENMLLSIRGGVKICS